MIDCCVFFITIRVYRGDFLLYETKYRSPRIEAARRYAQGFYAWDRISKVQLSYKQQDGTKVVEQI